MRYMYWALKMRRRCPRISPLFGVSDPDGGGTDICVDSRRVVRTGVGILILDNDGLSAGFGEDCSGRQRTASQS